MKYKDYYSDDYILDISRKIGSVMPDFDKETFTHDLTGHLDDKEPIRPLLKEHPGEVMDELIRWTKEENVHVRRLASEGVRIRLPWSPRLTVALDEFERYTAILTNLY